MHFYNNRLLVINLCWLVLGGQMVKKTCIDLSLNLSSTKVSASPRKSSQVGASWHKWVVKRNTSWMQIQNLCWLASPFGQGWTIKVQVYQHKYKCSCSLALKKSKEEFKVSFPKHMPGECSLFYFILCFCSCCLTWGPRILKWRNTKADLRYNMINNTIFIIWISIII